MKNFEKIQDTGVSPRWHFLELWDINQDIIRNISSNFMFVISNVRLNV